MILPWLSRDLAVARWAIFPLLYVMEPSSTFLQVRYGSPDMQNLLYVNPTRILYQIIDLKFLIFIYT
jgi:hypothetical protein